MHTKPLPPIKTHLQQSMGFLPCTLPRRTSAGDADDHHHSSHQYSLSLQPSLSSVASLTLPSAASASHHCAAVLKPHSAYVSALSLAGKRLLSASYDGDLRLWPPPPKPPVAGATSPSAVKALVVLNNRVFTAHQDHKIRVWKLDQNDAVNALRCITTLPTLRDRLLTPLTARSSVTVRRHKTCTWVRHADVVSALALSADGSRIYSGSWDRTVKIWRTSDFRCVESINAHDDAVNAVVASPDGRVYTGSADRKIKVWGVEKGEKRHSLVATLEKHKSAVNALALTTDGNVLYSGACDRSIVVWEKEAGGGMAVAGAVRGHGGAILCLAAVGERWLFSGSADKTVRVWRRGEDRRYECLAVLEGHTKPVKCVAAAVDDDGGDEGFVVYSGGLDCEVRVWRVSVGFS